MFGSYRHGAGIRLSFQDLRLCGTNGEIHTSSQNRRTNRYLITRPRLCQTSSKQASTCILRLSTPGRSSRLRTVAACRRRPVGVVYAPRAICRRGESRRGCRRMSLSNSPSSGDPLSAAASSRTALRNNVVAEGAFNGTFPSAHRFSLSFAHCRVLSLFQAPHKSSSPPLALSRASCIADHDYLPRLIVVPVSLAGDGEAPPIIRVISLHWHF
jgi:hypothetical protein